ncbi:MAG: T9SS type A sorting domain-containing protein, partial [Bacteroidota bacterium]
NDISIGALQYDVVHNKLYGIYRDTCCLMPKYFVEVDTLTADITILDTLHALYGTVSGSQVYDQATGTFIFIGVDTLQVKRLYTIDASTGQIISDAPTSDIIGDLECDNTMFAKSFYTSVQDAKTLLSNISVYPNPANGHFEIEFTLENPQTVNISIVNSIGQIVYKKSNINFQGNYSDKIDSRSFSNGNYILNIKTGENIHTENITVLH